MRLLSILLLLLFASVSLAQDEHTRSKVSLTIEVVNGTPNGSGVAGDLIMVDVYSHGESLGHYESNADADGKAVFEVIAGDHIMASARAKHMNVAFSSGAFELSGSGDSTWKVVEVYDVSDDDSVISIGTQHVILKLEPDGIGVTEYLELINPTNKAVISKQVDAEENTKVIEFKLFKGFRDLNFSSYFIKDACVVTKEGFYDTMAIPPGVHQGIISYHLDIKSSREKLYRQITRSTNNLVLFSKIGLGNIEGLGEASGEMISDGGISSEYFSLGGFSADQVLSFEVVGLDYGLGRRQVYMMSLIFGVIGVIVVYRLLSNKMD